MTLYEAVGVKSPKGGCDYTALPSLQEAKAYVPVMAATGNYTQVFIRQYRRDKYGRDTYRILHKLSWKADIA